MLSDLMFAAVETDQKARSTGRDPGLSISQLFPCPYRLYLLEVGQKEEGKEETFTPQQILNMEDGWTQEVQAVERLGKAGIIVGDRKPEGLRRVKIGRSNIPGSIDGTITIEDKRLWEFKAMNGDRFWYFKQWGISGFTNYKAQVNGYMVGKNLTKAWFQAKHKDSNDYYDVVEELDEPFIMEIMNWADKIRLEGWIPEPIKCKYCSTCGLKCFGDVIDMSWIKTASAPEMVDKWKKGKQLQAVGGMLEQEARTYFIDKIEDKDTLMIEDLIVKKITQHRFDVSKQKILQHFGPEGLTKVGEDNDVIQYRVREV